MDNDDGWIGCKDEFLGFQLGLIKPGLILWNYIRYCQVEGLSLEKYRIL